MIPPPPHLPRRTAFCDLFDSGLRRCSPGRTLAVGGKDPSCPAIGLAMRFAGGMIRSFGESAHAGLTSGHRRAGNLRPGLGTLLR